jgi:hypothetical protein
LNKDATVNMIESYQRELETYLTIREMYEETWGNVPYPPTEAAIEVNTENELTIASVTTKLDSLKSLPNGPDGEKIRRIFISYSYRAKNGMGALDKSVVEISYDPEKDSFEIR